MNKLVKPFRKPTTHVFFFCLFLVLLNWPLMTVADQDSPTHTMAVFLFVLWLIMIGALFVFGRTRWADLATDNDENQELDDH